MTFTPEDLRRELAKPGRSAAALARHMGRDPSIISKVLGGKRDLKARELDQIASYLADTEEAGTAAVRSVMGQRVAERLEATGQTARGVSIRAGMSPDALRPILSGRSASVNGANLPALARELGCDVQYLLGEADELGASPELRIPSKTNTTRRPSPEPIRMTVDDDGLAHLEIDTKVPLEVALQVLALVGGKRNEGG